MANYFRYKLRLADTVAGVRFVESGVTTKYYNAAGEWCVDMWTNVDNYGLTYKGTHCREDFMTHKEFWHSMDGGGGGTLPDLGGGGGGGTGGTNPPPPPTEPEPKYNRQNEKCAVCKTKSTVFGIPNFTRTKGWEIKIS